MEPTTATEAGDWIVANTDFIAMQAKVAQLEKQPKAAPKSKFNPVRKIIDKKSKPKMFLSNKKESKGYRASRRYQPPQDVKGKSITKNGKSFIWGDKHKKRGTHKTYKWKGIGINADADDI